MNGPERILLFSAPDQPGIIAAISAEIFNQGGNIISSEQCTIEQRFFLRSRYQGPDISSFLRQRFPESHFSCRVPRVKNVVLLASRPRHCLIDLLWRWQENELPINILAVISNVQENEQLVNDFDLPFYFSPQGADRRAGEEDILQQIPEEADFLILARYMRILSGQFLQQVNRPLINVHHSFLPAFPGAHPYQEAYQRGVKVIGATAHYVIEELDAGAIISQRVQAVDHRFSPDELQRVGREQERLVLLDAVRAHAEERIIVENNKTVVFGG